jgi:hypothetical protein
MSNRKTRSYRLIACALVAAIVASLVPHQAVHAEVADHAASAATVTVAAFQSGGCGEGAAGGCVTFNRFGFWCEACDCMYLVVGSDGHTRIEREHWIDCGVS